MRKRDVRLSKYGISHNRYAELRAICRQYPEWLAFLSDATTIKSPALDGLPKNTALSDTTGNMAVRRIKYSDKVKLIEDTAKEAAGDLAYYLLRNVGYGDSINYLRMMQEMPCDERTLYDARRYFYYLLDQKC